MFIIAVKILFVNKKILFKYCFSMFYRIDMLRLKININK